MKEFAKKLTALAFSIIITCVLSTLALLGSNCQWIIRTHYLTAELLALLFVLGFILLVAEVLLFFFLIIRAKGYKAATGERLFNWKRSIITAISIILIAVFICTLVWNSGWVLTSGHEDKVGKYTSGGAFYVVLQGTPYQISETDYHMLCVNTPYLYTMETKTLFGKTYSRITYLESKAEDAAPSPAPVLSDGLHTDYGPLEFSSLDAFAATVAHGKAGGRASAVGVPFGPGVA